MTELEHLLPCAELQWRDGQPYAVNYADRYFSDEDGFAETHYIFLQQNQLPTRWKNLSPKTFFTIGETGFGTGLNFLCAAKMWSEIAPRDAMLHFISTEKHPFARHDLRNILTAWQHQLPLAQQLMDSYPPPVPGFHRLTWGAHNITLTLLFGDAEQSLNQLRSTDHPLLQHCSPPASAPIDAWFFDGFAPAKNPQMWSPGLFKTVASLSADNTTFSTFTAAGSVRHELAKAGFTVAKVRGFGHKRAMLIGRFTGPNTIQPSQQARLNTVSEPAADAPLNTPIDSLKKTPTTERKDTRRRRQSPGKTPWYMPAHRHSYGAKQAIVVGGGIAGCTTAAALARRGWRVTLFERNNGVAREASGNPQAIIYPKLSVQPSPLSRFNLLALLFASRFYAPFWQQSGFGARSGVVVVPEQPADVALFRQLGTLYAGAPELMSYVEQDQLADITGVALTSAAALYFPNLGWIRPTPLCETLCAQTRIRVVQEDVADLHYLDGRWTAIDRSFRTLGEAAVVVVAAGMASKHYSQTTHLPLKALRGQITLLPSSHGSADLRTVICGRGFAAPAHDGWHSIGATYNTDTEALMVRDEDHTRNLQQLRDTDSELSRLLECTSGEQLQGRAALRCTSPDYLPLLGPTPVYQDFIDTYQALARNAHTDIPCGGPYWPGLYINCGHGSRGMSYAPLGAELLADQIEGLAAPLPRDLCNGLNPARFIIRDLKRHKLGR